MVHMSILTKFKSMGNYQGEGMGVKGFMSDRGSILNVVPETPRV